MVEELPLTAVEEALAKYRQQPSPPMGSSRNPFRLVSTLEPPARTSEVEEAWHGRDLPSDAIHLWAAAREARLFEDVAFGQWGLLLLSPSASAERTAQERAARPSEFKPDDIVIGQFLGDQDLVVLASETSGRRILISLPLDGRRDWFRVAPDLGQFLTTYFEHHGDKYWESTVAGEDR